MQVGILKAGQPPADLEHPFGSYPAMIRAALGAAYAYSEFDVRKGELPHATLGCDAYVITGSASSAYDADAWISHLREWLRALDPRTPLVGICFGHQVMVSAYRGIVNKARQGVGIGLHKFRISSHESWMDSAHDILLPISHYDQVIQAPPTMRVIATSDFCPNAALLYTDRRAVSFQAHPEFTLEYTSALIERWQQRGVIGVVQAQRARASLRQPDDRVRFNGWLRRFLDESQMEQKDIPGGKCDRG